MADRQRTTFDWVLTILGLAFIAVSILALGWDAQLSFAEAEPTFKPIGLYWYELHVGSYNGIQVLLERYIWPPLWDPVLLSIIQWPVWVLFLPIGILLFIFGRR
jgi:hypothetical protein